ncbi:MAG: tetratricopeptide repeat protein [Acidobacteriota bacterium]
MKNRLCLLHGALVLVLLIALPAIAQEPASPNAAFERALRLYRDRNFGQALEELSKVAELAPQRAEVHYLIGYCHLMRKEFEESLNAFRRAFDEDPNLDPRTIYQKSKSP